ncbi:MAG: right-handed parallel beta-helix repeat-containing protein, partial [Thermoguttaceae bacterium]|nr:right-handed parallel beta-helix repeat-containing protein [Thermoguttaceae bacterium]
MKKPFVLWNWMFLCLLLCGMNARAAENELMEVSWPADGLTLQEAYDKTAEDGTLTILRGVHDVPETLVIRKNITITGQSTNRDDTVLKGGEQNVLRLETGFAEIKNLTIKNEGDSQDSGTSAVRVLAPLCAFENCLFTSEKRVGFLVDRKDSSPIVTRCAAKNCGSAGFVVCSGASGTFTDCESSGNALSGIEVSDSGTNPTVEKCRFTNNQQAGIVVYDGASGTFTDCEASENAESGILVRDSGTNPTVEKCRFTNNQDAGILVSKGASGTFTDCEASENAESGI